MKLMNIRLITGIIAVSILGVQAGIAQVKRPTPLKPLIMAVLNDGKTVEPIAYLTKGKLEEPAAGDADQKPLAAFVKNYYPVNKVYSLIFGGASVGTVTIKGADPSRECSRNMADVITATKRTTLKGNIMALATNAKLTKPGTGVRRLPTVAERAEVELLVREELSRNNVPASSSKTLKYQNLTAVDVDGDGRVELVGSYWSDTSAKSRALLAFIADLGTDGKYALGYSSFNSVEEGEVMSSDIKDIDTGVYHERLLDLFDVDGDGISEIFTYTMSFEGAGFNVYKRTGGKWASIYEFSNYHCGY